MVNETERSSLSDEPFVDIDCLIECQDWQSINDLEALSNNTIAAVVSFSPLGLSKRIVPGAELSLVFTDAAAIQSLNRDHRGKDAATNVLSFPQAQRMPEHFGPILGDIVFAWETINSEAKVAGKPVEHHLQHLLVHGFLHLFGYDHQHDDEAEEMEKLEVQVLHILNLDNPYQDN